MRLEKSAVRTLGGIALCSATLSLPATFALFFVVYPGHWVGSGSTPAYVSIALIPAAATALLGLITFLVGVIRLVPLALLGGLVAVISGLVQAAVLSGIFALARVS